MKRQRRYEFGRREYTARRRKLPAGEWGHCDDPDSEEPEIVVSTAIRSEWRELATWLHEMMHAGHFDAFDERHVKQWSETAARLLIDQGWRKKRQGLP